MSKPIAYMRAFNVFAIVELQHYLRLTCLGVCLYICMYTGAILRSDGKKKNKWKNEKSDLSWKM